MVVAIIDEISMESDIRLLQIYSCLCDIFARTMYIQFARKILVAVGDLF